MEDVVDSVRRIISRWVETATPILSPVAIGDTVIDVSTSNRFRRGDEVQIAGPIESEPNLVIEEIIDNETIRLATPVQSAWSLAESPILQKLMYGMMVEGIYIGDPEVIPKFPAITVSAMSLSSEWMTLDSTKEHFEIEISIYVLENTFEDGQRFLLRTANTIREGLRQNIYPLVNDFDVTAVIAPIDKGDFFIKVADSSVFKTVLTDESIPFPRRSDARLILEDRFTSMENRCRSIVDETTVELVLPASLDYRPEFDTVAINPKRFIYNSWPKDIQWGKTSKGSLLQTATIRWFAEEEVIEDVARRDPHIQ